jgi:serine O-acetyltransferase
VSSEPFQLDELVNELEHQVLPCFMQLPSVNPRPNRTVVYDLVYLLKSVLFPGYFDRGEVGGDGYRYFLGQTLERFRREFTEQVTRGLCFRCQEEGKLQLCRKEAQEKVDELLRALPEMREILAKDADAAFQGDPAAHSHEETVFCYPGMTAIAYHRIAHKLYGLEVPLIARIIAERAHSLTGIDIHPGASIGEGIFIDHGTGVVIGETSVIGSNVRIYQGVTLGARSFPTDENGNPIKGVPRHPIVEDRAVIYSGATVLGRITVGKGSVIGGNVWLTESVPPHSRVSQGRPRQERFQAGSGI